tara:strand:- start:364 stop:777 length:414 start_codon:yes stop_codon:yes gene_type:complete
MLTKSTILPQLNTQRSALDEAHEVQTKAIEAGFEWNDDIKGVIAKCHEELDELLDEIKAGNSKKAAQELGDVLFSVSIIAYYLGTRPEDCLRESTRKFYRRFTHVEQRMKEENIPFLQKNLMKMDAFWNEAKTREKR